MRKFKNKYLISRVLIISLLLALLITPIMPQFHITVPSVDLSWVKLPSFNIENPFVRPVWADSVDLYWIGGAGNYNDPAHWSTSTGGAGGHAVPTATNAVIIDDNSDSGGADFSIVLQGASYAKSLDFSSADVVVTLATVSYALAVSGSITLDSGMSITSTTNNLITMAASGTVTTNGVTIPGFGTSNSITVTLADDLNFGNYFYPGTSVTFSGNFNIIAAGPAPYFSGNGNTYYGLQLAGSSNLNINGTNTFTNNLTLTPSSNSNVILEANQTVSGTLVATGNSVANRLAIKSNTTSARTLAVATNGITDNVDFYYIDAGGASAPWDVSAISSANMGGNVDITFLDEVYYVGDGGNWTDSDAWSGTSGGTANANWKPTVSTNKVFFDGSSFTANGKTLVADGGATCGEMDWTGVTETGIYLYPYSISGSSLYQYGNCTLVSGLTIGYDGGYQGTSLCVGGGTLTTNSASLRASPNSSISIGSTSYTTVLADNISVIGTGSLSFAGTITPGTSVISSSTISSITCASVLYEVVLTGTSVTVNIAQCTNFTRTGTATVTDSLTLNASMVVTGTLTLNGNSATNRLLVKSGTVGTARTLTAATVVSNYCDYQDIIGAGAGGWDLSAGIVGDLGGNTDITFTVTDDLYWYGGDANYANASRWFLGTGGTGGAGRVPLPQDTAKFDASSFTSVGVTVTLTASLRTGSLDCTGASAKTPVFTGNQYWYGSITLCSGTWSGVSVLYVYGRTSKTLSTAGVTLTAIEVGSSSGDGYGQTLTLASAISCSSSITLYVGTLVAGGYNISCASFASSTTTYTRALTMTSETITVTGTGTKWNIDATNFTFTRGTSTIYLTQTSATGSTFTPGTGVLYYTVEAMGSGNYTLTLSAGFTAVYFIVDRSQAAKTLSGNFTITTTGLYLNASGITALTITNVDFSQALGTVSTDYATISGSAASGGAAFYAGANSTNGGTNSGWTFSAPVYPTITNVAASNLTNVAARLNGNLSSFGGFSSGYVYFQYNTTDVWTDYTSLDGNGTGSVTEQPIAVTGTFHQDLTGLTVDTIYYFRAVLRYNLTDYIAGTPTLNFNTTGYPVVATGSYSSLGATTVTLIGTLSDRGIYSAVNLSFEYGTTISYGSLSPVPPETQTGAVVFSTNISGLLPSTEYHYRIKAEYLGSTSPKYGSDATFTTTAEVAPTVSTQEVASLGTSTVSLQGLLTSFGSYRTVYAYFEWGTTVSYGNATTKQTLTSIQSFESSLIGMIEGQTYHYRANIDYINGAGVTVTVNGSDIDFTMAIAASISNQTPLLIKINAVDVYSGAMELNDQMYFIDFTLKYGLVPSESISESYFIKLFNVTGSELKSSTPYAFFDNGYNRGIVCLYFSASEITSLSMSWNGNYSVKLMGNPSADFGSISLYSVTSASYSSFVWHPIVSVSSERTVIARKVINYAKSLTTTWNNANYVLWATANTNYYLTSNGQTYFGAIMPYLTTICPDILQNNQVTPTILPPQGNGTSWQTAIDNMTSNTVFEKPRVYLGTLFNVSGRLVTGVLWLIAMLFIIYKASHMINSYKPAILLALPLLVFGILVGWIPVLVGLGLGFFCIVLIAYVLFYEKSPQ